MKRNVVVYGIYVVCALLSLCAAVKGMDHPTDTVFVLESPQKRQNMGETACLIDLRNCPPFSSKFGKRSVDNLMDVPYQTLKGNSRNVADDLWRLWILRNYAESPSTGGVEEPRIVTN